MPVRVCVCVCVDCIHAVTVVMDTGKVLAVISGTCLRVEKPVGRVSVLFFFFSSESWDDRDGPGTGKQKRNQTNKKKAVHLRVVVVVLVLIYKANARPPSLVGVRREEMKNSQSKSGHSPAVS